MQSSGRFTYLVGFGSNLGNRLRYLEKAFDLVEKLIGPITAKSRIVETDPLGPADQKFLNGVFVLQSASKPLDTLEKILKIETDLGRKREIKWGNRPIDLDILLAQDNGTPLIIDHEDLQVPHPQMLYRDFVLNPCQEIAGGWFHPIAKKNLEELAIRSQEG